MTDERLGHGLIGNGRVLGLVHPSTAIEWLCMPRFDSQSVFGRLLDAKQGGVFRFLLDGQEIVYVMRVHTHKILSLNLGVGSRLPAYCTSMGRLLLSGLSDADAEARLRASELKARTHHTLTGLDELMREIRRAREQGWCLVDQELEEGLISMAAPVYGKGGEIVAALNISGQANRTDPAAMQREMLPALREAAQTISRLLRAGSGR